MRNREPLHKRFPEPGLGPENSDTPRLRFASSQSPVPGLCSNAIQQSLQFGGPADKDVIFCTPLPVFPPHVCSHSSPFSFLVPSREQLPSRPSPGDLQVVLVFLCMMSRSVSPSWVRSSLLSLCASILSTADGATEFEKPRVRAQLSRRPLFARGLSNFAQHTRGP